ncbi:MAG: hypothetical protein HYZ28_15240 [Myxococcales bacterium]|nr:hypothetical protein [Myxococcales bacterium]
MIERHFEDVSGDGDVAADHVHVADHVVALGQSESEGLLSPCPLPPA